MGPDGQLVWSWKSQDHIALAETGRHWPWAVNHNYDIAHWNSIEPAGDSVIASFRHFDAVYKIRKSTGEIVWKLGGTAHAREPQRCRATPAATPRRPARRPSASRRDPDRVRQSHQPGQSQSRGRCASGSTSKSGTATLLESISDPDVSASYCCGSARRLESGDWLVDWGKTGRNAGAIGGYAPSGERTFLMSFGSSYNYRAEPVPDGLLSARKLRRGDEGDLRPESRLAAGEDLRQPAVERRGQSVADRALGGPLGQLL